MIGALRHEIALQSVTRTPDGAGGFTAAWDDTLVTWAQITPRTGLKRSFAGKLEPIITHVVLMRYQPDVTTAQRIRFGARIFQIHAVINHDELDIFLELHAVEGAGS